MKYSRFWVKVHLARNIVQIL